MKYTEERRLDLHVTLRGDEFEITVSEPESGLTQSGVFCFSHDEHPEFDLAIGNEIYSWISMWKNEADEIHRWDWLVPYRDRILQDDDTECGGVMFEGETVLDFLMESGFGDYDIRSLDDLNVALKACGIKEIRP